MDKIIYQFKYDLGWECETDNRYTIRVFEGTLTAISEDCWSNKERKRLLNKITEGQALKNKIIGNTIFGFTISVIVFLGGCLGMLVGGELFPILIGVLVAIAIMELDFWFKVWFERNPYKIFPFHKGQQRYNYEPEFRIKNNKK